MRLLRCGAQRLADSSGVILLSALLAVALLTLIVVEMTDATLVGSHLNRNAGNSISAQLLARSAEAVAEALLVELKKSKNVTLMQGIGVPIPDIPVGDGSAGVLIEDEQGKLDLNMVDDPDQKAALENLFKDLDIDPALLDSIAVWITKNPDRSPSTDAAATCALTIPCVPPGGPLRSLDELALIKGFEPAIIERLRPYATAYGRKGHKGVNINTARAKTLTAIGCPVASDFSAPMDGFEAVDDPRLKCDDAAKQGLRSTTSNVFSVQARGTVGDTTETLFAIVDRSGGRPKRLHWRERPVFAVAPIGVP
jgi:general secretion pathway protein K